MTAYEIAIVATIMYFSLSSLLFLVDVSTLWTKTKSLNSFKQLTGSSFFNSLFWSFIFLIDGYVWV